MEKKLEQKNVSLAKTATAEKNAKATKKTAKTAKKSAKTTQKSQKKNLWESFLYDIAVKIARKWDKDESIKLAGKEYPENITEIANINYAGDKNKAHTLDIYFKPEQKSYPILIDIHGGAFVSGGKFSDRLFCYTMADEGFLVFNVGYTLALKNATVFDEIVEVHSAVGWILSHAVEYGGNLSKIYFSGHSAGAVLAVVETLLNLDDNMRKVFDLQKLSYDVKGLILNCGFMRFYQNILPYQMCRDVVFPPKAERDERYKFMVFINNQNLKLLPKTFLITNSKDEIKSMTLYFNKLLEKVGVPHELCKDSEGGHVGLIYDPRSEKNIRVIRRAIEYLEV